MLAYRVLARLLTYPDAALIEALPAIGAALQDDHRALPPDLRLALGCLIDGLAQGDLLDHQERYGALFDRVRSLSLHLFEHVHGDSRARGSAMLDLIELYRRHGLEPSANELPDYLPLYLEFLSTLEPAIARGLLGETAHILAALHGRLAKRASPYAAIFQALLHLAAAAPEVRVDEPEEDESFAALDRAWEEAAVMFGPDARPTADGAACPKAARMLERMQPNEGERHA
jgi:nitrate reductase molybdenum cofactor assembly chaperone NarJ/NarW